MNEKLKIKIADNNKHIPTEDIKKDIRDTEAEIITMKREIKAFELLGDRISRMQADVRVSRINDREIFIKHLKIILEVRKEQNNENK